MSKNISFISENVLEEKRKQRQEEWLKTRKESDPIDAPEPEYDPRTLYERLKEQKQKKQDEYDESRKLKNLIRGLDNDEIEFLNICDENKIKINNEKYREELLALEEYKQRVSHLNIEEQETRLLDFKRELFQNHKRKKSNQSSDSQCDNIKNKSQADLLSGAIKRKKLSNDNNKDGHQNETSKSSKQSPTNENKQTVKPTIQCIGRLPGIGCYDDESDSLESDRDSDESSDTEDFNAFGHKLAQLKQAVQDKK